MKRLNDSRASEFAPLSSGLSSVVKALKGPDTATVKGVFGGWADAVGAQVAAHARPVKLDGSVLLVEVDEPGWATQLRFLEADLLERLTATGSLVSRIEVRVNGAAASRRRGRTAR
jgi:predicted nucleic acid-binding Zn ribbon protein